MGFAEPDDLPTYVGLSNTLLGIPVLLAPILGGWLVDLVGFGALYWSALLVSVVGWAAMLLAVREPRVGSADARPS